MSEWKAKRFWEEVSVYPTEAGFAVKLDARSVRTPSKALLRLPTLSLAEALAEEWRAVDEVIRPETMPLTRACNSAIDKVSPQFPDVVDLLAGYGGSDLLCYRADSPAELVARQAEAWDPWLHWSASTLGALMVVTTGVIPRDQPAESLAVLRNSVQAREPFALTGLHDLVVLSGSLVLGLAVADGALEGSTAWDLSRIDEDWQAEQWGHDSEAAASASAKRQSFLEAESFLRLLDGGGS